MDKQTQMNFVGDLVNCYMAEILGKIINDKIPVEWDGIELRQYIIDCFNQCKLGNMNIKRKKEYNNTKLINNL